MALSLEQYREYYSDKESPVKHILKKRSERLRKKSVGVLVKNGGRIPEHLIVEILSWLPVKTLLRFKTVCKSWYAIISSSHFITKHLRNYYDNDNNWRDCLIVQYAVTQAGELNVYELLIDDKKNRTLAYQMIDTPIYNTILCGPCNGIYFQWIYYETFDRRSMWNPALNELIVLPDVTWKPNISSNSVYVEENYGFGYDSKTDDYKVILIFGYMNSEDEDEDSKVTDNPLTILIYSLRTNSWRNWGDMDNSYRIQPNGSYVYLNGCYYWLAAGRYIQHYEVIVAFDIAGDAYHEIPLPHFEREPSFMSHICVYRDSIAFVHVPNPNEDDARNFSVWTWSEGVCTPKLYMKLDHDLWGGVSHWRDDSIVFKQVWGRLILYDTHTKETFVLDDPSVGSCRNICAYKESLVSIKGYQNASETQGQ